MVVRRAYLKLIAKIIVRLGFILALISLGLYWNRLFEALLTLVAILQLELAYRQHWMSRMLREPYFDVRVVRTAGYIRLDIRNVGETPAYDVMVARVLIEDKPLPSEKWEKYIRSSIISCLPRGDFSLLAVIDESFFKEHLFLKDFVIEVHYRNIFDDWNSFSMSFFREIPIILSGLEGPPSFLTALVEEIRMLIFPIRMRRILKEIKRKSSPEG